MAEPVGEFNLKNTGNSFNRTSDGQLEQASDFEGEATGFGAVFGTLVITQPLAEASQTKSACAWIGKALLGDNSILGGIGDGTIEQVGPLELGFSAFHAKLVTRTAVVLLIRINRRLDPSPCRQSVLTAEDSSAKSPVRARF